MIFPKIASGKSGTREVAIALLMFWAFITGYVFFYITHDQVADYKDMWMHMTTAVLMFAAAAFGLNYAVQNGVLPNRGNPDCPPHVPVGRRQHPSLPAD